MKEGLGLDERYDNYFFKFPINMHNANSVF